MRRSEREAIAVAIRRWTWLRDCHREDLNPAAQHYRDGVVDGLKMAMREARRAPREHQHS